VSVGFLDSLFDQLRIGKPISITYVLGCVARKLTALPSVACMKAALSELEQ